MNENTRNLGTEVLLHSPNRVNPKLFSYNFDKTLKLFRKEFNLKLSLSIFPTARR